MNEKQKKLLVALGAAILLVAVVSVSNTRRAGMAVGGGGQAPSYHIEVVDASADIEVADDLVIYKPEIYLKLCASPGYDVVDTARFWVRADGDFDGSDRAQEADAWTTPAGRLNTLFRKAEDGGAIDNALTKGPRFRMLQIEGESAAIQDDMSCQVHHLVGLAARVLDGRDLQLAISVAMVGEDFEHTAEDTKFYDEIVGKEIEEWTVSVPAPEQNGLYRSRCFKAAAVASDVVVERLDDDCRAPVEFEPGEGDVLPGVPFSEGVATIMGSEFGRPEETFAEPQIHLIGEAECLDGEAFIELELARGRRIVLQAQPTFDLKGTDPTRPSLERNEDRWSASLDAVLRGRPVETLNGRWRLSIFEEIEDEWQERAWTTDCDLVAEFSTEGSRRREDHSLHGDSEREQTRSEILQANAAPGTCAAGASCSGVAAAPSVQGGPGSRPQAAQQPAAARTPEAPAAIGQAAAPYRDGSPKSVAANDAPDTPVVVPPVQSESQSFELSSGKTSQPMTWSAKAPKEFDHVILDLKIVHPDLGGVAVGLVDPDGRSYSVMGFGEASGSSYARRRNVVVPRRAPQADGPWKLEVYTQPTPAGSGGKVENARLEFRSIGQRPQDPVTLSAPGLPLVVGRDPGTAYLEAPIDFGAIEDATLSLKVSGAGTGLKIWVISPGNHVAAVTHGYAAPLELEAFRLMRYPGKRPMAHTDGGGKWRLRLQAESGQATLESAAITLTPRNHRPLDRTSFATYDQRLWRDFKIGDWPSP